MTDKYEHLREQLAGIESETVVVVKAKAIRALLAERDELLAALRLALEYWADRQQRYKNRAHVWVQEARAAIARATGEQA